MPTQTNSTKRSAKEEVNLNKLSIDELRRIYDEVQDLYGKIRVRVLTYLGAEFALFSYLYIGGEDGSKDLFKKLFIPPDPYGVIIYCMAFLSCLIAFTLLILAMQTVSWTYPTEIEDHEKLEYESTLDFLKYVRSEYANAIKSNISHCERKQWLVTKASYLLMFGGILLIIIKNF